MTDDLDVAAVAGDSVRAVRWLDGRLWLLDQRALPTREDYLPMDTADEVTAAIRDMVVRGAPAIGVAAAYGVAVGARHRFDEDPGAWRDALEGDLRRMEQARPTAVNLAWAVRRMRAVLGRPEDGPPFSAMLAEARRVHREDLDANRRMGEHGAALIAERCAVLTHCNAGSLATGGYGTALGVVRNAYAAGRIETVFADETRPWLQGARLTAWELVRDGVPVRLIADGAAAWSMRTGQVRWVIVGADRVAANGDVANKIGTCALAACARQYGVRFMVAAPTSTIDPDCPDGEHIPIECRDEGEVLSAGTLRAAEGAGAWNPVFDVTPAGLVDALVTERGVVLAPDAGRIAEHLASSPA